MSDATPPTSSAAPAASLSADLGQHISYTTAPHQPGLYPPRQLVPWNGLAIASLVLSIVGLGLIGVILGHIALGQIKRTGEQGGILATVGVVLGYLGILVAIIISVVSLVLLASGSQLLR